MKNRIFELMKSKGKNQSEFAESIQISNAVLSSIRSGRTNPTLLVIENIKNNYPDVNLEWLFTGEGDMYINTKPEAEDQMLREEAPLQLRTEEAAEYGSQEQRQAEPVSEKTTAGTQKPVETVANIQDQAVKPAKSGRNVRQVIIMYDDDTYETLQK